MKIAFDDGYVCWAIELPLSDRSIADVANEVCVLLAPGHGLVQVERITVKQEKRLDGWSADGKTWLPSEPGTFKE